MKRGLLIFSVFLCGPVFGQFAGSFAPVPGTDFSGNWSPAPHDELVGNPALVEYYGVPINEGAQAWGLAWSPSRVTLPEHQCQVHLVSYIYGGPLNLRIWEERDPQSQKVIAIRQYISTYEQNRTIWMDGRPHPSPNAPHTWMGFSTGKWEGDMLTVYTTHIKTGWLRRNGLPESDRATMVEHFIRHGNYLTHVSIVTDPVYLTEPLIKSEDLEMDTSERASWLSPCEPVVEVVRPKGEVPNYLPGANPFLHEFADRWGLPYEPTRGGAETTYPEYRLKLKTMARPAPSAAKQ